MKENPDTPVVEMDSVEGVKGGKVQLTIISLILSLCLHLSGMQTLHVLL